MKVDPRRRKPVRKIIHRGSPRVTGRFVSRKMRGNVPWESLLERDHIHTLEFARDVIAYHAQPTRIQYRLDGVIHTYVPDFEVECLDRTDEIHEVKPDEEAEKADNIRKFSIYSEYFDEDGFSFKVITESDIRKDHCIDNIEDLFRFLHHRPKDRDIFTLLQLFDGQNSFLLGELVARFSKATIYALISQGELDIDIYAPLISATEVRLGEHRRIF